MDYVNLARGIFKKTHVRCYIQIIKPENDVELKVGKGPKCTGIPRVKRMGFVKPDSVKLAMGHLLHGEAAPWNHALQTPVPPWIQGLVRHVPCIRWSVAVDPLSATAVPLHLTQFAVPFVQIVATVCLQGTWFYMIFLWHVQCMVHGSRTLGWFNRLFF